MSKFCTVHDAGSKPKDNQLSLDWAGKKVVRREIKVEFLRHKDYADAERDKQNFVLTASRKFIDTRKEEIRAILLSPIRSDQLALRKHF